VWIGETELEQGVVRAKHMEAREETNVAVEEIADFIRNNS